MKILPHEKDALEYALECLCFIAQDHAEQQDYDGQTDEAITVLKALVDRVESHDPDTVQTCIETVEDLTGEYLELLDAVDESTLPPHFARRFDAFTSRRQLEYTRDELRRIQQAIPA